MALLGGSREGKEDEALRLLKTAAEREGRQGKGCVVNPQLHFQVTRDFVSVFSKH